MKLKNLLLIVLFSAPLAFGQMFPRVGELPLPAVEAASFGNLVAGVDLDGDGKMEIYLPNNNWNDSGPGELVPRIYKYEYNGAGGFDLVWQATLEPILTLQNTWPALTVADLDKDGKMELVWGPVNYSPYPSNTPRVIVYEAAGDGSDNLGVPDGANPGNWLPNSTWAIDTAAGANIRPFRWFVADPDGDNTNELVFVTRNGPTIFNVASVDNIPDNGDGSETWTMEYSGGPAANYSDLSIIGNYAYVIHTDGTAYTFKYDAGAWSQTAAQAGLVPGGSWLSACTVDINSDSQMEIVVGGNGSSAQQVFLLQPAGDSLTATSIADLAPMLGVGGRLYGGASGDIDNDGMMDFVFGSRSTVPNAQITRLEYMGGDITLPASYAATTIDEGYVTPVGGSGRWMYVAIGDVDEDPSQEVLYTEGTGELAPVIILDHAGVVPVELNSFSAAVVDGFVNLKWSTATESNNRGFEVQRKAEGTSFATIGFVEGKGTTTDAQNYSFVDNSVQTGKYQYRLKQMDLNGQSSYSNVVEVNLNPNEFNLAQNYPNPFNPSTTINFSLAKETNVNLRVFDLLGQQVVSLVSNEFMQAGSYSYKFDASTLSSGTYIYRLEAGDFVQTKKMTLTK